MYPNANIMFGHSGMNYGSETLLTGFNYEFNYSMILSVNAVEGASCEQKSKKDG